MDLFTPVVGEEAQHLTRYHILTLRDQLLARINDPFAPDVSSVRPSR